MFYPTIFREFFNFDVEFIITSLGFGLSKF